MLIFQENTKAMFTRMEMPGVRSTTFANGGGSIVLVPFGFGGSIGLMATTGFGGSIGLGTLGFGGSAAGLEGSPTRS